MARYEIEKRVRTPDGAEHATIEAANAHMRALAVKIVADAGEDDLRWAIAPPEKESEPQAAARETLRDAIRDLYLQVWPRAPKGSKTPAPEAASEPEAALKDGGTSDPVGTGPLELPLELPPEPTFEPTFEITGSGSGLTVHTVAGTINALVFPTTEVTSSGDAAAPVAHSRKRSRG